MASIRIVTATNTRPARAAAAPPTLGAFVGRGGVGACRLTPLRTQPVLTAFNDDLDRFDEDEVEDDPLLQIVVFLCYALMALSVFAVLLSEAARVVGG